MNIITLTSQESRTISNDLNNEIHSNELIEIMENITKRCNSGFTNITYENKDFKSKTISKLKELGYQVNYGQHYNDKYIEVNWK